MYLDREVELAALRAAPATEPAADRTGGRFRFGLLGPLEVVVDGRFVPISAAKHRVLLASLLLNANAVVPVETLERHLWGHSPPAGARNTLQNYVLRLRRTLGNPAIVRSHPGGYSLEVAPGTLDIHRVDALLAGANAASAAGAVERASAQLGEALALWRGQALADVDSDVLVTENRPVLDGRRIEVIEQRIEADLSLGRHHDLLAELHELTTSHPLVERFWAQRMRALCRSGRASEALVCYHDAATRLGTELGVDPGPELQELHRKVLTSDHELATADRCGAGTLPGNLPAEVTSFVGREKSLRLVDELLATARVVTLTGIGGVGKTRVALHAGAAAAGTFRDGVWFVDLATLTRPELLSRTVAEAFGIRDQASTVGLELLVERLRRKHVLLVLDNCEHVGAEVAALTHTLLKATHGLRVLATSRTRLGVPGEHVLVIPPLATPDVAKAGGPEFEQVEAVRLLMDRAAAAAPQFALTDHNRAAVAQLCRRLDGIPLAIELAAVRLGSLAVEEILERLDDRFTLLTGACGASAGPGRDTLAGVLDWSHELCSEPERLLWARLSQFSGGFDLVAAETVCAGTGLASHEIVDLLARLVHQSVLTADTASGRTRYQMLETLRQYGQWRLAERGEATAIRWRHHTFYRDIAAHAAAENCGNSREVDWQLRLRSDMPNLRAAMDFGTTRPETALGAVTMATDLSRCSFFTGDLGECRHWLARTRAAPGVPIGARVTAGALQAWIATVQGDHAEAAALLAECAEHEPELDDETAAATVSFARGNFAMFVSADPVAIELLAAARDAFRHCGATSDTHMATLFWAMAAVFLGDRESAMAASAACIEESDSLGGTWVRTWALWTAGISELKHGDPRAAAALVEEALERQRRIGDRWGPMWSTEVLAWAAAAGGRFHHASHLLRAAAAMRGDVGVELIGLFAAAHDQVDQLVRHSLTDLPGHCPIDAQ